MPVSPVSPVSRGYADAVQDEHVARMDYQEHIRHIAPLNTFDAKAFEGDEKCPQSVCDFVLALAAIHNDLNDFALAMDLLKGVAPKPPVNRSIA